MKKIKIILVAVTIAAGAMAMASCKNSAKRAAATENATEQQAAGQQAVESIPNIISMAVIPAIHTGVPESIEVQISNNTGFIAQFGAEFTVERANGEVWEQVPGTDVFPVPMILHTLEPGESETYTFHLRPDTVKYEKGLYRLSKNVLLNNEANHVIFAEFEIQ